MCGRRWMMDFFFFNDTATTEIYTLSLHDALPILKDNQNGFALTVPWAATEELNNDDFYYKDTISTIEIKYTGTRSEEHTSELQSRQYLVCRLLLEKKNTQRPNPSLSP